MQYQYFISHCEFFPMYFKMNLKQSMCNCTVHVQCFQQSALRRSKTQSNGSYLSSSRLGNYLFKQKTKQTDKRKKKQVVSILQKNFPSFWPFCGGLFKPHFTIDKLLSQCLGTNIQVLHQEGMMTQASFWHKGEQQQYLRVQFVDRKRMRKGMLLKFDSVFFIPINLICFFSI